MFVFVCVAVGNNGQVSGWQSLFVLGFGVGPFSVFLVLFGVAVCLGRKLSCVDPFLLVQYRQQVV